MLFKMCGCKLDFDFNCIVREIRIYQTARKLYIESPYLDTFAKTD